MILNKCMKFGKRILLLSLCLVVTQANAQQFNEQIQDIIEMVSIDSLIFTVKELSGEVQTLINDTSYTIASRNRISPDNAKAAIYLKQKLESYGLETFTQDFVPLGTNIYAVQTGIEFPDKSYILCAHYDSMPQLLTAPGADDNASGTAAVLEAARILSKYYTKYTLVYALWDNEESGLLGSAFYAQDALIKNQDILGVLNMDMIAWDNDNDGMIEIHTSDFANSKDQAFEIGAINNLYNLGNQLTVYNPGTTRSDHASFWQQGYSANLLIEEFFGGDFNANYHSVNDKVGFFNIDFFRNCTKLAMATIATWAEITGFVSVDENNQTLTDFALLDNYPNPFNPETTIPYILPKSEKVRIGIFNISGQLVSVVFDGESNSGLHVIKWNGIDQAGRQVSSGIYFYRMETPEFTSAKRMILLR